MLITLLGFLSFTIAVALITWLVTRKEKLNTSTGYFLGGRSLGGFVIASSLLLTNISAEQLVGMNGATFSHGIVVMGWSATAATSCVIMALILLPKYLSMGITTINEFLADRFDDSIRRMVALLSFLGVTLFGAPITLYAGGLAIMGIIDVPGLLGVSEDVALITTIIGITFVGGLYAIFGGLKAVAMSDTVNGVGLIVMGLMIPTLGLITLGDGNFFNGVEKLVVENPQRLNAIGGEDSPLPFSTFFTGLILAHIYAWSMNQSFIQRVLGAKSLKEGQKGVLIAAVYKVLAPLIIALPGVLAFALYGDAITSRDLAYQTLVSDLLPTPLLGVFLAVVFGCVLSTFNSQLNSSATIFCIDIYKPYINSDVSDVKLVRVGMLFSFLVAIVAMTIAPLLINYSGGLFQYARIVGGLFNMPILLIIVTGIYTTKVSPLAVKLSTAFFVVCYGYTQMVDDFGIHFLHISAILTVIAALIIYVVSKYKPNQKDPVVYTKPDIDLSGWKYRNHASCIVLLFMVSVYLVLSPLGIVTDTGDIQTRLFFIGTFFVLGSLLSFILCKRLIEKKRMTKDVVLENVSETN